MFGSYLTRFALRRPGNVLTHCQRELPCLQLVSDHLNCIVGCEHSAHNHTVFRALYNLMKSPTSSQIWIISARCVHHLFLIYWLRVISRKLKKQLYSHAKMFVPGVSEEQIDTFSASNYWIS